MKWSQWSISKYYYTGICLEGLKVNTKSPRSRQSNVLAEIRNEQFLNTSLEAYILANQLGLQKMFEYIWYMA
jgi:hypothetical protein